MVAEKPLAVQKGSGVVKQHLFGNVLAKSWS